MFDTMTMVGREALAFIEGKLGTALAQERSLPLAPFLAGIFPEGGLRQGSTVVVGQGAFPGATYLALLLLASASAAGSWCAVVGAPDLGLVAASQMGVQLERLALVPEPGAQWPVVTASLLEGFDIVLLHPPQAVRPAEARKLQARARERGAVLAVVSAPWPEAADMRLCVSAGYWHGLERGHGHIQEVEIEVSAEGRGAAARLRKARACVPTPAAMLSPPELLPIPTSGPSGATGLAG